MTELSNATGLSPSRMTRLVDGRFFDHIDDSAVEHVAGALTALTAQLQDRTPV